LTWSSLDICTKLQKLVAEGGRSLDQLVQVATAMFYNRDLEKERWKNKCQEVLITAMQWLLQKQALTCRPASFAVRKAILGGSAFRGKDYLWDPALSVRQTTGSLDAPAARWNRVHHFLGNNDGSWDPPFRFL
jgi:hypothetical protein